jgi:hypothetical protein
MPEYQGDFAVTLPNLFPNPGQAMQSYIIGNQRNTDSLLDWHERKRRQDEMDEWKRIGLIKTEVNPEDVATGNVDAQVWFDEESKRVQKELLADINNKAVPPTELFGMIQKKWLPVVQGSQVMKMGFSQIDQNTKQIGTEQKHIATDKLSQAAKMNFLNDWMPINPATGKREYKNQGHMPDRNYAADIINSPERWRYVQGGALQNYLTGYKAEEVNPYKQLSKDQSIVPFKGRLAPWSELNVKTDENNKMKERDNPQVRLKTEDDYITEGNERIPIKVLHKDVYKAHVLDIPENNDDMTRMWEEFKEKNNIKRAFAVGVFQQHDPSEIHGLVPQHLPRNTTNLYVGRDEKEVRINDLYRRIDDQVTQWMDDSKGMGHRYLPVSHLDADAQTLIMEYAKKISGDSELTHGDIKIKKDGDKVGIYYADNDRLLGNLNPVGTNLKAQPSVKEKREVIKDGEQSQQKAGAYNIKGKDYSEAELLKMGYTKEQIAPYKK